MGRGRPERELDPDGGPIPVFAAQLRDLRERAGRPSYRDLARKACYSRTALSEAAAGRELPSLPVTLAFVRACDGPVEVWRQRWKATAATVGSASPLDALTAERLSVDEVPSGTPSEQQSESHESPARADVADMVAGGYGPPAAERSVAPVPGVRRTRSRTGVLVAIATAAVAVIAAGWLIGILRTVPAGVTSASPDSAGTVGTPSAGLIVDGAPPGRDHCDADNAVLDGADLRDGAGAMVGRLELRYSPRCAVAWARLVVSGNAGTLAGITMTVTRRPDGTVMGSRGRTPVGNLHTDVVRLPPGTCAQAQVSLAQPGHPLGSVATTCQPPHLPHSSTF